MTTIVLDDKYPYKEKRIDNAQQKCQPITIIQGQIHQYPDGDKRTKWIDDLDDGFSFIGDGVLVKSLDERLVNLDILHFASINLCEIKSQK